MEIEIEDVIEALRSNPIIPIDGTIAWLGDVDNNSITLFFNSLPDANLVASIKRSMPNWISDRLHIVFDTEAKTEYPLFKYGYFLLKSDEINRNPSDLTPGDYFKPLKNKKDKSGEFYSYHDLWDQWASRHTSNGIFAMKRYGGRPLSIWVLDDGIKIFTENKADISNDLPNLGSELLSIFGKHTVGLQGEITAYDCAGKIVKSTELKGQGDPIQSFSLSEITPELENCLVLYLQDLIYYDIDLTNEPFRNRITLLSDFLNDDYSYIALPKSMYIDSISELQNAIEELNDSNGIIFYSSDVRYPIKQSGNNRTHLLALLNIDKPEFALRMKMCPYQGTSMCSGDMCSLSSFYICSYLSPTFYGLSENAFKSLSTNNTRSDMSEQSEVYSMSSYELEDLADKLRISGIALAPGFWKGVLYKPTAIKEMYDKFKRRLTGMFYNVEHGEDEAYEERTVGQNSKVKWDDDLKAVLYSADIDDQNAIDDVKGGRFPATSMRVAIKKRYENGVPVAYDIEPIDNTLTSVPACRTCRITYFQEMSEDGSEVIYYGVYNSEDIQESLNTASSTDDTDAIMSENEFDPAECPSYDLTIHELAVIRQPAGHWNLPKADLGTSWDFRESAYSIEQLKRACTIRVGPAENKGSYKLPHHTPSGTVVWRGVDAAIKALKGARGGVHMPTEDRGGAFAHLNRHAKAFGKKVEPLTESDINEEDSGVDGVDTMKCSFCGTEVENMSEHLSDCASIKAYVEGLSQSDSNVTSGGQPTDTPTPTEQPTTPQPTVQQTPDTPAQPTTEGATPPAAPVEPFKVPIEITIKTITEQPTATVSEPAQTGEGGTPESDQGAQGGDGQGEETSTQSPQQTVPTSTEGTTQGTEGGVSEGEGKPQEVDIENIIKEASGLDNLDLMADLIVEAEKRKGKWSE